MLYTDLVPPNLRRVYTLMFIQTGRESGESFVDYHPGSCKIGCHVMLFPLGTYNDMFSCFDVARGGRVLMLRQDCYDGRVIRMITVREPMQRTHELLHTKFQFFSFIRVHWQMGMDLTVNPERQGELGAEEESLWKPISLTK